MAQIGRNVDDHFSKTPTPHFPRSRFDQGIHKRLQTQGHGRLYPFFARVVYPGDTWQMDINVHVLVFANAYEYLGQSVNEGNEA